MGIRVKSSSSSLISRLQYPSPCSLVLVPVYRIGPPTTRTSGRTQRVQEKKTEFVLERRASGRMQDRGKNTANSG